MPGATAVVPACSGGSETSVRWNGRKPSSWAARWTCCIRGLVFSFAIEPSCLVPNVRTLLRSLEIADTTPDVRIEIHLAGSREAVLIANGVQRVKAALSTPGAFKDGVHQVILENLYPDADWFALLHSGAVRRGEIGLLFPAQSGSGKTTLIAYLLARGYDYLADDLVALAPEQGLILPWPLPLSIKSASFEVLLPLYPHLDAAYAFSTKGDRARLLVPPNDCWNGSPVPLNRLIFPQFEPNRPTSLEAISSLEAVERIIQAGAWLGHPLLSDRVQRFLDCVAAAPAFVLRFGELEEAAIALESTQVQTNINSLASQLRQ